MKNSLKRLEGKIQKIFQKVKKGRGGETKIENRFGKHSSVLFLWDKHDSRNSSGEQARAWDQRRGYAPGVCGGKQNWGIKVQSMAHVLTIHVLTITIYINTLKH